MRRNILLLIASLLILILTPYTIAKANVLNPCFKRKEPK